ncbi:MAG: magnesium chelatase [SAR202 cluster bacterium]|nr:magnesium chelatase [Verrucomicrobiales bacterium]MQG33832.1 magnesium chelatase [SAR202 cluster bacterium]HCP23384.1 magnesium chelatase [Dehalococcoidia bacterium]
MPKAKLPQTIGALRKAKYEVIPVREELRKNLIAKIRAEEIVFPGIVGFEHTVIPQLENAILAGQDIILLGERGQAKSRMIRSLTTLLDEAIPKIADCEINDNPYEPICQVCRDKVAEMGDKTPLEWIPRDDRYSEKLATPDISIADLIGEIDPIKVAEGHYLSDELVIHYGLVPRTNRGIFCINELPDLAERIQVGLFNLMEERDVQIKGYRVRLPLDVFVVSTANPEDYTNRGRIVTPLKDRYGSQIHTHYPLDSRDEIAIMDQERTRFPEEEKLVVPDYMKEVLAEVTVQARQSNEINQRSGVSVRVSIANYETMLGNAVRRAIMNGEEFACPRVSDLSYIVASFAGKIELETFEEGRESRVTDELARRAVLRTFGGYFDLEDLDAVVTAFDLGNSAETGSEMPAAGYPDLVKKIDGLAAAVKKLTDDERPEVIASAVEFILEGLHLSRKLNCDRSSGAAVYRL